MGSKDPDISILGLFVFFVTFLNPPDLRVPNKCGADPYPD
jgi:hypothetical protein